MFSISGIPTKDLNAFLIHVISDNAPLQQDDDNRW
jgi:hypothetical protein